MDAQKILEHAKENKVELVTLKCMSFPRRWQHSSFINYDVLNRALNPFSWRWQLRPRRLNHHAI